MSRFSDDDLPLTEFLRNHQPVVPSADVYLEDRLMTEIVSMPHPRLTVVSPVLRQRRIVWAVPSVIAASFVAMVVGYRTFVPSTPPSAAEVAELQTFIESTWHDPIAEQPDAESDLIPMTEDSTLN
jgi:hypothetical protein